MAGQGARRHVVLRSLPHGVSAVRHIHDVRVCRVVFKFKHTRCHEAHTDGVGEQVDGDVADARFHLWTIFP